jgi:peptidoglycan glycosyltransferase
MNAPMVRVYAFLLLLLALLAWKTSQWAVFDAQALKDNSANHRPLIETQTIHRGEIKTADGTVVAESSPQGGGAHPIYVRHYPTGSLFGNPVGWSFINTLQTGIEKTENDALVGDQNEFSTILDQLRGTQQEGANVTLTIDANAQRVATDALNSAIASTPGASGYGGSVVALDPRTGAVKAMVSVPGYDPNLVRTDYSRLANEHPGPGQPSPIFNRATQSSYPPGSTMKVVTATAALDSGQFTPSSVLSGATPQVIGGVPLSNAGNEPFGDIDMTTALTNSVNTYFGQVGEKLGTATMYKYMNRFGFFHDPQLDYPTDQMVPSGVYGPTGNLLSASAPVDIGRVAIGQANLTVTPTQMAEVAAAVANDGVLEKPTFVQQVTDTDGRTISSLSPQAQSTVMSPKTASELTSMMTKVTQEGTAAGLTVQGLPFAGKTGTAEIGDPANGINQPWFIGFAPASDPKVAVAATVERCQGCFGGEVAGPIATQVMDAVLAAGG